MTEISRERRDKIRERLRITGNLRQIRDSEIPMEITVGELRALLNYADERDHLRKAYEDTEEALRVCSGDVYRVECERDEAVAVLRHVQASFHHADINDRIDTLLQRIGEPE